MTRPKVGVGYYLLGALVVSHAKKPDLSGIVDCLARAAAGRNLSPLEPWNYGWSIQTYRHSPNAAMEHDSKRAVSLNGEAIAAFEEATIALLRLPNVAQRYDSDEFWSLMASLVGTLPMDGTPEEIEYRLTRSVDPPDSLVVLPLANVAPIKTPIRIGALVIGPFDYSLAERLRAQAGVGETDAAPIEAWWPSVGRVESDAPMTLAYQTRTQSGRALHEAEEAFSDAIAISLALEPDLDGLSLYSLRGDAYRPGTRGLVLDRVALAQVGKTIPRIQRELGAPAIVTSGFGQRLIYRWAGESPFPVEKLLAHPARRDSVERILTNPTAVHRRLRVAARWHAKAHWASDKEDAVLALGICFDAMLTEQSPSPGRALADRYAFLASDPVHRRARYKEFQSEFYPARSSVAHGAKDKSIDAEFVRRFAREARMTFGRILELSETHRIVTEDDYDELYASLKWGGSE